jgi:menaquinone-dependent protoporphyrinogen IX oxidase
MKGIIIYKSRYGSTKQFSEWLQAETGFNLCKITQCPDDIKNYDTIVIGSSIHGGRIALDKWIIGHWEFIKDKRVVLMLTSGSGDFRNIQRVFEQSLPENIRKGLVLFPVGGRYVFKKMSLFDRTAIQVVAAFTKHPEAKKGMLTQRDEVRKENLSKLINHIKL